MKNITNENWTLTKNGADALSTSGNSCLDFFATVGSMRGQSASLKYNKFITAFEEEPLLMLRALFYTRDIRGGYGERDTFTDILRRLANYRPETVIKNLWAVVEFGRAKDLYCLIGTEAEEAMWKFMKEQFELDYNNMLAGKQVSLLAKWMASPKTSSKKTTALGRLTYKKLGYDFRVKEYTKMLTSLRAYLDLPEIKMSSNRWDEIEYAHVASMCMSKRDKAFKRHDKERYEQYLADVKAGKAKMNTSTINPCDLVYKTFKLCKEARNLNYWLENYGNDGEKHQRLAEIDSEIESIDIMWNQLPDNVFEDAVVLADVSGSMNSGLAEIPPIAVSIALAIYISSRCKGPLKNVYMTFSESPIWQSINFSSLREIVEFCLDDKSWGRSTNLEAAFNLLLTTLVKNDVSVEDMPKALIVVSDMHINRASSEFKNDGDSEDIKTTFTYRMKDKFAAYGYEMPQLVYWNVNSANPVFHASKSDNGVTLVSGFSTNVLSQVFSNLGKTPYEMMVETLNSDRYSRIEL